ncbi:MAG: hypothetical protein ACRYE8_02345 [Janthinobacterium lividum]
MTRKAKACGGIIPSKSNFFIRHVDPISPPCHCTIFIVMSLPYRACHPVACPRDPVKITNKVTF